MLFSIKNGQTSNAFRVKLRDSSQTDGRGLTGLTNASSGLVISTIADNEATATAYTVAGSNVETIATLGTFAAPTAGKCRFKEVDATNHPGLYELQIADSRFAVSGAKRLVISISGATNLAQCDVLVLLTTVDPYDGTRGGMTALPNANAGANGGLPVLSNSAADLAYSVKVSVGTGTGQINLSSGKVPATIAAGDLATDSLTAAALATDAVTEIVTGVWAAATRTLTSNPGLSSSQVAAAVWDEAQSGHTTAGTFGQYLDAAVSSRGTLTAAQVWAAGARTLTSLSGLTVDSVTTVTGNVGGSVGSVATGVTVATNNDKTGYSLSVTPPTAATISAAVWDLATTGHTTANTFGAAAVAAGSAGDPWSTALPGSYGAGSAGYILGNRLDALVSSRLATSGYTAPDNTGVAAIKAKTDNLPAAPAAVGDIPTAGANADALLGRNILGGSSSGRLVKEALATLRNKVAVVGTTLTVYSTDDTTPMYTATVTDAPGADPISAIDPA